MMNQIKLNEMLHAFLLEDIGEQDLTSQSIFPPDKSGKGVFIAKGEGTIAGLEIIRHTYHLLDPSIQVHFKCGDGDQVFKGETFVEVSGPIVHLLAGEGVILNLLQGMSGIETLDDLCIGNLNNSTINLYNICET